MKTNQLPKHNDNLSERELARERNALIALLLLSPVLIASIYNAILLTN